MIEVTLILLLRHAAILQRVSHLCYVNLQSHTHTCRRLATQHVIRLMDRKVLFFCRPNKWPLSNKHASVRVTTGVPVCVVTKLKLICRQPLVQWHAQQHALQRPDCIWSRFHRNQQSPQLSVLRGAGGSRTGGKVTGSKSRLESAQKRACCFKAGYFHSVI